MASIQEQDRLRVAVVKYLYDRWQNSGEAPEIQRVREQELASELGEPPAPVERAVEYLVGVGFMARPTFQTVCLTWTGARAFEESLRQPDEPTEFLAPVNILNVGTMIGSQIQQGTIGSSQTGEFLLEDNRRTLLAWVDSAEKAIPGLGLDPDTESDLQAQLETIRGQLTSPRPRAGIIREALRSTRSIVDGIAAGLAAQAFINAIPNI